jgi:hypothetical protein
VLVEAAVLDGDRRVADVRGDVAALDRRAQRVGLDEAQPVAVAGEDLRARALLDGLDGRQRRRGRHHADDPPGHGQRADRRGRADDSEREEGDASGAPSPLAAPSSLAFPARHSSP